MKRSPLPILRATFLIACCLTVLATGTVFAQFQTGNIFGTTEAKDGAMLPGVTVTLTGPGATQTFVTDSSGNFRFLNLSPGEYSIKAELSGFGTAIRKSVQVSVGSNATVALTLQPSVEQSIIVTAEAPLIDTRKTGTGAVVTKVELEQLPTGRDPWVIMGMAPGVLLDRVNVGGSESGQQDVVVARGATDAQKTFNLDGVNITDVGALGSTPTYYDFDSFEEIQITTGGSDPRIQTPGAQLNMVTKRGTNDLKGTARYFFTPRDWYADSDATGEAHNQSGLPLEKGNSINTISNWSIDAGGPLWKDKAWLWGSYARQDIKLFVAQPVDSPLTKDNTILKDWNGKINAQFIPSNSLTYLYTYGDKLKFGRGASPTHPPETTLNQSGPSHLYKIEDTQVFNQNLYLTVLYAHLLSPFQFIPRGGDVQPYRDEDGVWHRSYYYYNTKRPQDSYRADGSYFLNTGSLNHELKFGFGYRKAPVTSSSIYPATGVLADASQGDPSVCADCTGLALLTRNGAADYVVKYNDFYVGDTIVRGNLTVQGGLRFDRQKARNGRVVSPANTLAPDVLKEVVFGPDQQDVEWNSVSPRIGFTYKLGAGRGTLLRGSYNQYVDQLGGGLVSGSNPFSYANGIYYFWRDSNHDTFVQRGEVLFNLGPYGGYYLDNIDDPNSVDPSVRVDYDMSVPKTKELIFGFETEVVQNLSIGADLTWRRFEDFWWIAFEKTRGSGNFYGPADFERAPNLTGALPNGQTYSIANYRIKVPFSGLGVITTRPDYYHSYQGIDVFMNKRMANRWMMRANMTFNNRKQHVDGDRAVFDPSPTLSTVNNQFGCTSCDGSIAVDKSYGTHTNTYLHSKWSGGVTALYQLPWTMTAGLSLSGRQGYPVPWYHRVNNGDGLGSKNVLIDGVDPVRMPNVYTLDLRLGKDIDISRLKTQFAFEIFNVTDRRTELQRDPRLYRTRTAVNAPGNNILELQSPRAYRLTAKVTFQ